MNFFLLSAFHCACRIFFVRNILLFLLFILFFQTSFGTYSNDNLIMPVTTQSMMKRGPQPSPGSVGFHTCLTCCTEGNTNSTSLQRLYNLLYWKTYLLFWIWLIKAVRHIRPRMHLHYQWHQAILWLPHWILLKFLNFKILTCRLGQRLVLLCVIIWNSHVWQRWHWIMIKIKLRLLKMMGVRLLKNNYFKC